jgi:5,10-methylenetetrahydrofolate reductase
VAVPPFRTSLAAALSDHPLFFEPAPPSGRTAAARVAQRVDEVATTVAAVPRVDAIDVPDLVDENHEGRPFYRSLDPRAFGRAIAERAGREAVINKVVAHLADRAELEEWLRATLAEGLHHVVLVGGNSRYIPYPGPPVAEANRIARPLLQPAGGLVGNIAIPSRTGEGRRMLSKSQSGAGFFTTQLLFEVDALATTLREYDALCRRAALPPGAVLLSFAPIADEQDAEFVRWLGAELPEPVERALVEGSPAEAVRRGIDRALEVWTAATELVGREGLEVPLGVNVEQISARHEGPARELLAAFAARLGPRA